MYKPLADSSFILSIYFCAYTAEAFNLLTS
nr:MAG TPA: hypothetical protein [Caudoviricetes sp.]